MEQVVEKSIIPEPEDFKCKNGNSTKIFCCDAQCLAPALICRNQACSCFQQHGGCNLIGSQAFVSQLRSKFANMATEVSQAINSIEEIYHSVIDQLSQDLQKLNDWKKYYGLSPEEIKLVELITSGQSQKIKGKLIGQIKNSPNPQISTANDILTPQLIERTWELKKPLFKNLRDALGSLKDIKKSIMHYEQFNFETQWATAFKLNRQEGTIEKVKQFDKLYQLVMKNPLSPGKLHTVKFRVITSKSGLVGFGIVTQHCRLSRKGFDDQFSLKLFADKRIAEKGKWFQDEKLTSIANDSVVEMNVDMNKRQIWWNCNGKKVAERPFPDIFEGQQIYMAIELRDKSDKIQLLIN